MAEHAVEQRQAPRRLEADGRGLDQRRADREVTEHRPLVADPELGAVGELAGLADVVEERRRHQQIRVELRMELADLADERPDRDRVLEEAAEVGVMAAAGTGRAPELRRHRLGVEDPLDDLAERLVVDLAGQVLEKPVQLVDRAVRGRQELGRVERARLDPPQRRHLGREVAAEALDLAADLDRVAALEAGAEQIDVAEDPGRNRAGPVAELEAQVGRAVLRLLAILAYHRKAPREGSARLQRRDPLGGRSGCGIGGGLIDAAIMQPVPDAPPGPPDRRCDDRAALL